LVAGSRAFDGLQLLDGFIDLPLLYQLSRVGKFRWRFSCRLRRLSRVRPGRKRGLLRKSQRRKCARECCEQRKLRNESNSVGFTACRISELEHSDWDTAPIATRAAV